MSVVEGKWVYCVFKKYRIQVCCDANRKVTWLSILSPGVVPDLLTYLKGSMNRSIEQGKLPSAYHFIGDNTYPGSDQLLVPYNRCDLRNDVDGRMDNYNYYMSQLRINIECCFGMLVNKFPILQTALLTTKLRNAVDVFHVCCILHNLCIPLTTFHDSCRDLGVGACVQTIGSR